LGFVERKCSVRTEQEERSISRFSTCSVALIWNNGCVASRNY
jgi:hypothetical protein